MGEPLTSLDPIRRLFDRRPFAILTDFDGTISPLAATPSQARVTPRNRELLERLSRSVLVGVVSGRDLGALQRLVGLPDLLYIGLHGLAWRIAGSDELAPEAEPYRHYTEEAAAELASLKRIDGLVFEVKSVGLALHYRKSPKSSAARFEILRTLASSPSAARFDVHEAIRVVELRPPLGITKGVALVRLVDRFNLQAVLYLGDDLTDLDAFLQVQRLREQRGLAAASVAVAHQEAPAAAAKAADFTLSSVERVEWLLGEIAAAVSGRESAPGGSRAAPT